MLLLLPLWATVMIVGFLIEKIGAPATSIFFGFLDESVRSSRWINGFLNLFSTLFVVALVTGFGWISHHIFGRLLLLFTENVIVKLPFINSVYRTVKQIVDTFGANKGKSSPQKAVLVEFPRAGMYSIGFSNGEVAGEIGDKVGEASINVFIPTTPNPTSGFLVLVRKTEVIDLDMTVGDAMKVIISGGAVIPEYHKNQKVSVKIQ